MKIITLKFAGTCKDCGAELEAGSKAKWYGRGRIYGMECHDKPGEGEQGASFPEGKGAHVRKDWGNTSGFRRDAEAEAEGTRAYVEAQAEAEHRGE